MISDFANIVVTAENYSTGHTRGPQVTCDLDRIDFHLHQLLAVDSNTNYAKQKKSLKHKLESFLHKLPAYVTLETVTTRDLCWFLIYKDEHGKTQVHQQGCHSCGCLLRLSYKSIDSYIGKLRAIFHTLGRDGAWDRHLGLGNPASDKLVQDYLWVVTAEQLHARITPKTNCPFFVNKLTQLSLHLKRKLKQAEKLLINLSLHAIRLILRWHFLVGNRPGDLGHITDLEILRFPNDDGFLCNHVWGKTLRDGDSNVFGIRRNPQIVICPIKGLELYMDTARQLGIDLICSHLFRPTASNGSIKDNSLHFYCGSTSEDLFT
ncbi:Hypothetical predicted protein [Paramuricea clavata]|uniref:Uncharacterized protein n=1 Tax=Paramuricea clavata TaxID=317549 RepID=A0A6S7HA86_PARCT|nr:Hypothetical predicted protein [Paramuricea clavata]